MGTNLYIKEDNKYIRVVGPEAAAEILRNIRTGASCSKSYVYLLCHMTGKDGKKRLESFKTDAGIVITERSIKVFNQRYKPRRKESLDL